MSGRNPEQEQEEKDEEDDFGEFGGFEAADPADDLGAAGGQALASPWAALASASAGARAQPDLLCPQNSFPPYLDPSGIAGSPLDAGGDQPSAQVGRPPGVFPDFNARFEDGQLPQNGAVAERPFPAEGANPMADVVGGAARNAASYPANGRLPDIGLGTNQNPLFAEGPIGLGVDVSQNAQVDEEAAPAVVQEAAAAGLGAGGGGVEEAAPAREAAEVLGAREDLADPRDRPAGVEPGPQQPVVEAGDHNRLQRELDALQSSNLVLSQELERSQGDLAAQRSRLQAVQQQHLEQLEATRQSGHDALAVVVEQYKELSRTAVLEQQEAGQRHLVDVTEQQMQRFQRALQAQRDEGDREREQAKTRLQTDMEATLETLRTEQQEKFDAHLAEDRRRQEEAIRQAVQEETVRCQTQMQEAIAEEQRKAAELHHTMKEEHRQQLEEQRGRYEDMLKEQRKVEREQAQERLSSCLEEERQRGRDMADRALQDARTERNLYVQQQRQSDSALRRRQLASLDLFLESSRRQVDLLLNAESPPPPDPAPHPQPPPSPDQEEEDS